MVPFCCALRSLGGALLRSAIIWGRSAAFCVSLGAFCSVLQRFGAHSLENEHENRKQEHQSPKQEHQDRKQEHQNRKQEHQSRTQAPRKRETEQLFTANLQLSGRQNFTKASHHYTYNGGVVAMRPEHWRAVNGFSNDYHGWGGEDDDLFLRAHWSGLLFGEALQRSRCSRAPPASPLQQWRRSPATRRGPQERRRQDGRPALRDDERPGASGALLIAEGRAPLRRRRGPSPLFRPPVFAPLFCCVLQCFGVVLRRCA